MRSITLFAVLHPVFYVELRELPASLSRCPLRMLSANDNPLLELLPSELFVGLTTLATLRCQQTRVDVLPSTVCEVSPQPRQLLCVRFIVLLCALKAVALAELLVDVESMFYPPSDVCKQVPNRTRTEQTLFCAGC